MVNVPRGTRRDLQELNERLYGEKGTERKVFHSLRHGVAQLLDRNQIPEDRIALLLGHTRGNTETFRTYSKNAASPVELQKYIELLRYPEIEKGLSINKKSNFKA